MPIPAPIFSAGSIVFDGSVNSAIIEPHTTGFLLASGTLEFDFVANQINDRRFLFSKDSGGFDDGGHLGVYIEDGALVVRIQSTNSTIAVTGSDFISAGQQHHVAVTFGSAEGLTVYVDGVVVATNTFTGGLIQNQEPIVLGANQWASGDFVADDLIDPFEGTLTRFSLYNEALNADEVGVLFNAATGDPNNTSPIAQNDTAETDEDAAISIVVLANDSDPDGDTLTVVAADAINGAVQIEADSSLTYVPNADFNGIDTISYSIDDGRGGRTSATVDVTVNAINDAPTAADATFQISSAAATNDVLGQVPATDVDGDTLSYSIIAGNDAGVFGIDASGTIFVADRDALDPVTTPALALTVSVSDGVLSDTAAVSVNVSDNIVPAPILEASALTFSGNTASAQVLPHSDTYLIPAGTLEFDFVADAINGRRFLFSKDSGGFDDGGHAGVYIENGSIVARFQSATQTFVAQSTDLISVGSRHHVAVTFGGLDGLQIFVDGEAVATNAFTGGLGGNQEPIVIGANQWGSGDLVANNLIDAFDGDLARFALYSEVLSTDQIAGLANNGISVPGNNAPVAADDVIVVDEDTAITIGVLANDIDPDGDSLDVTQASASNGTVTINANGALEYTPDADFNGADTINYTADDRRGGTDTASVAVTVAAVNDAPVIGDATFTASTTVQNNDVIGTVSANDVDGDVLTFAIVGGNDSGAFGIDNSGNLLIVDSAALNQQATQSFALSVAVSDGQATSTGAVTVNVSDLAIPVPILASADLSFDGSTASAQILPHLNAYLLPEGTLEFDFTPDAVNGRRFLFSKDSGGFDDGGHLGVYVENGELVVRIQSTTATFVAESANLILPGESYHVAVTFGTEGLTVYLDGQEVASNAFTGGLIQNQEPIVLGANQWASGDLVANNLIDPFDGNISRFALYGEALSADQVLELAAPPPVNTAPVLDAATLALDEGQTNAGTITATDADGDALTFALTANADTDNALFAIDAATGALSFLTPPDFESAQDANGDNVYVVEVQADDGNGGIASGQFNVTVNDVGEAVLQISGAAPFDFGGINAGTNSNAVFMVNNVGDGAAASIQIGQLDFPFLIPGGTIFDADTLDAGAAASLTVQFAPDSAGNFSDDLELSYFGGVSNQFLTRELLGEGIVLNAPPVAVDDSGFGDEDTAIQGNVLANDSDPDGNPLTARLINDVSSGVLTLDADGSFNYTPESDFSGTDSFSYVVNDGSDNSAEATVTLNVEAVADVPTLTASLGAPFFEVGTPVALNIATDVTDLDGSEAITEVRVSGLPEGAMLSAGSVQADGSVVLTSDELAGLTLTVNPVPAFDVSLELSGLDGTNGFQINGIAADDQSGYSVSDAGDVNGDGIDDVIIGARFADPGGNLSAGQSYVVFGSQAGFAPELDLSSLDGTNGFQINGIDADDQSGISVSGAGDVNGDGIDDVIVGAWFADPNGLPSAGESYVVFGSGTGFDASFDLSSLDGENGIVISGRDAGDFSGFAVSGAGDFNGDGIEDIIVGAFGAEFFRPIQIGETYVVFGSDAGFGARIDLDNLNGANGFALSGIAEQDLSGASVANAGDVNGDGLDDIIIGAQRADRGSTPGTGQSYVVFGSTTGSGANLPLATLDGTNGFSLSGVNPNEFSGTTVASAGDINGDGFDDVIIGTEFGFLGGDSYVVFGSGDVFEASLNLSFLDGTNGFTINGIDGGDRSGRSVSGAGDVNGDGIDDLIVGATDADPNGNSAAGESYVVFGSTAGFGAEFDLASLDGTNGFQINGIDADDESGFSVSGAGDINGDGVDDLIIGATGAGPIGNRAAGGSYVVFGRQNLMASDFQLTIEAAATDTNPVTSSTDTTTASTTVAVSSQQPNTAPEASDDADYTIDEDNTLSIGAAAGVLGNDTDADGDPLTTTLVTGVANGTLTLNADGSFDYTPNADFSGTDSFTYVANDGAEDSAEATVTITVNPVNDAPTFEAASFAIDEGQTVAGTIMATDADGDALTFALTANADTDNTLFAIDATTGALSFLAPPDFENAQDADGDNVYVVEVQADDGNGGISSSQFNVTVNNVGEAMLVLSDADPFDFGPAAQRVTVSQTFAVTNIGDGTATNVDAETALPFAVAGGSALDADGVEPGATRALFVTFQTFSSGLFGEDLVLSYFDGVSDQVLVRGLLGEGLTLAPIAVDDIGVGDEDTDIQGNVLTNDSDPDGDPLRATLLVGPANGTVVINDSGNYTYTPEAEFNGTDSFTYTLEDLDPTTGDPLGPFDIGTVTITVNPINDAPVASPTGNTASGDENTVINGTLPVASDVDDDVSTLTYELAPTLPPLPPVVINPDGTFEVTPPADFVGDITFDYIVRDPSGAISDPQVFTVTVLDTNTNAVIAGDLTGTVTEDVDLIATGELSVADPDAGEDQVIAQIDTAGQFGKFSVSSDGAWSYTLDNTVAE
ncbi:MAG: Ig-like domain-containing protein, partial [Pseudomonadota bacterium]